MRAFSFNCQWMSTVRRISCQEVEKRRLRYRVRINSPRPHRTIPLDPLHRMPFGASCRLPIGCIGRQRHPPQSGYRTRPYSVMRILAASKKVRYERQDSLMSDMIDSSFAFISTIVPSGFRATLSISLKTPFGTDPLICSLLLI